MNITLEFSGGAELLLDKVKKHEIILPAPANGNWTIKTLLVWVKDNLLKQRPELFIQGDSVRPGILVLVNDADWELVGELSYELQPNDRIVLYLHCMVASRFPLSGGG